MTAQFPDKIIYKGKKCALHTNPLESYFAKYREQHLTQSGWCSGLWRGYVATFEIRDKRLYLKDIEVPDNWATNSWKSVINDVFPNQKTLWYHWTGRLVLPSGDLVKYVHCGYLSEYEHYTLLHIRDGELVGEMEFDHTDHEARLVLSRYRGNVSMFWITRFRSDWMVTQVLSQGSLRTLLQNECGKQLIGETPDRENYRVLSEMMTPQYLDRATRKEETMRYQYLAKDDCQFFTDE